MITRLSCVIFLALSCISLLDAQRTFTTFDGNDFVNANNGGVDGTLRGFDPNMRVPRFQNRRLVDLPRPLQMEVINALIANGVRGSRVANGFIDGIGGTNGGVIRTGGVDINTRRFAMNGAQGRGLGVDTITATGANGGGIAGRRFTANDRFGDTITTTRIGRIPPATGGQTIDLGVTRATGRIGGRPVIRTTPRITGGMPRSGILGGLGSNVDDLFLDPVSGRRVLVRPIGVANNIVNQRTTGDGGISVGTPDMSTTNGFRRFPSSTFAGGPQTNIRRQQLPIFPANGVPGAMRPTGLNRGFPNNRVSAFPFGGIQTDISSNVAAPQPIDLSSLEPLPDNFMPRPPFNIPPPMFDARRRMFPPARPPPGLGAIPRFPRPPVGDRTSVATRTAQTPNFPALGSTSSQTVPGSQSVVGTNFQTFGSGTQNSVRTGSQTPVRSGNSSIDVQIDDFLSSLDALIAAEASSQNQANGHNHQRTSSVTSNTVTNTEKTSQSVNTANTNSASAATWNDFTLPTSLPDPQFRAGHTIRRFNILDSNTDSFLRTDSVVGNNNIQANTVPASHFPGGASGTNASLPTQSQSSTIQSGTAQRNNVNIGTVPNTNAGFGALNPAGQSQTGFSSFGRTANNGFSGVGSPIHTNNQINPLPAVNQNLHTGIPRQSLQEIRNGAINAVRVLANSAGVRSLGFFQEGQGPTEGAAVVQGDSFIDWSHFNKALQDNGFGNSMPSRTDINGNNFISVPSVPSQNTQSLGSQPRFK